MELLHTARGKTITITVEPINEKLMGFKIKDLFSGAAIATFEIGQVWDFLIDSLAEVRHPEQFIGLERRCNLARKVSRLSYLAHKIEELTKKLTKESLKDKKEKE